MAKRPEGIDPRHRRDCAWRDGKCTCPKGQPIGYQAWVFDKRTGARPRKTFKTLSEAKGWRRDALAQLNKGTMVTQSKVTLREAATKLIAGMKDGSVRNRSGHKYKPSVIRGYERSLNERILPDYGAHKLTDIRRNDVQDLADRFLADGLDPSTVRNHLMPLRVIFRRALARGEVGVNPTIGLELPAVEGKRDRIAPPEEAAKLLAALKLADRGIYGTATYAGLRLGELQALRRMDVDLAGGVIRVEFSWDPVEGPVEPKSKKGKRKVPIPAALRDILVELLMDRDLGPEDLVFGRSAGTPFSGQAVSQRAERVWTKATLKALGLHEARHTYASLMIAAGVNAKALSTFMGHANVSITMDRYGHLFPGSEEEAAGLLDTYLEQSMKRAEEKAREADPDSQRATDVRQWTPDSSGSERSPAAMRPVNTSEGGEC